MDNHFNNLSDGPAQPGIKVLNQLLAAGCLLNALDSTFKMSEFVARALKDVPGIGACAICLRGSDKPIGDDIAAARKACDAMKKNDENRDSSPIETRASEDRLILPIATSKHVFGYIFLELSDRFAFAEYKIPVYNFINLFTMRAENLLQTSQLTEYQKRLEDLVAARTAELEKARAEAETANRAKSIFLANVSHELRTPMNSIMGFNELMHLSGLKPEQDEYCRIIKSAASHLLEIINDMLDFSRLEANKFTLEVRPFNLIKTIESAVALVSKPAAARNLKLTFEIDSALPETVCGDQQRFRQIIINLLTNAIKFTEAGSVAVRAVQTFRTETTATVSLSISDTGIGIPADMLDEIFEMFRQLDDSITKRYGGVGLGLAVVKNLIKIMNGTVRVESQQGQGSKFTVEIPFALDRRQKSAEPMPAEEPPRQLNILMAEDDEFNSLIIEKYFKRLNWNIVVARNGSEAVSLYDPSAFDAILMDIQMPVMNGFEAAQKIRQIERGSSNHVPIIAFTAFAFDNDREKCISAGMDDYITKPINVSALKETILKNIGR